MPVPRIMQSLIRFLQACDFLLEANLEDLVRQQNFRAIPALRQAIGEVLTRAPDFFPLTLRMMCYPLRLNDSSEVSQFHPQALRYTEDGYPLWSLCDDHVTLMVGVYYWTGFQRLFYTSISITFDGLRMQLTAACGVAIEHQFRVYVGTV
ncbi:uncharacterized protein LOC143547107 [Bidens hawaiensis]|uniref:uncharacterized protein LOC143547107 n=1 Tax=Bidens hawaiensis TaxID=980011 RepID=UPI004049FA16